MLASSWAGAARAAPVYLGSAAREGVSAADREAFDALLVRALQKQGIPVLDTSSAAKDTAARARQTAREALEDASAAYADEDWRAVLDLTAKAFKAYENGPAYSDAAKDADLVRDILALRALAALSTKKRDIAHDSMRKLLVLQPKYAPNKKKAPRALLRLVDDVRDELRATPAATLEVKSRPPGARVVVDGKRRGKAPVVIEDLSPGTHYVALDSSDGQHTERVELAEEGARVLAKVGGKKRANAREVLALVEKPVGAAELVSAAGDAGDDVVVAVLLPAGKNVDLVAGRIKDGEVRCVLGITAGPLENERETAAFLLAEGIREQKKDRWLEEGSTRDPGELRQQLFSGKGSTVVEEEGEGVSPALIAVGVIGGVAAVTLLGVGVAVFAVRESRKDQGFTWSADASRL